MPAPKTPYDAALAAALGLLRVRGRSEVELQRALERREHAPSDVAAVLLRLKELGYLNDQAFAKARAATLLRGRLGPDAIRQKLAGHGLGEAEAGAAIEEAIREQAFDPVTAAREVLTKRRLQPETLDAKGWARAGRLLASRGYSEDVIEQVLGTAPETEGF